MNLATFLSLPLAAACSLAANAQVFPILPYARTMDVLVVDSTLNGAWRLADLNQDGDYNDPGEILLFYGPGSGGVSLSNPSCIATAADGTAYVGDTTVDVILALRDLDGNGDAMGPGENWIFFDSATNASGIAMAAVQGITVDLLGRVFCAVANAGSVGVDMILKLEDLNQDGDANDPGEASIYCLIPGGSGPVGNSIPTKVIAAPDGNLYYAEVGSTGAVQKGVYRLADLNFNGNCNDPGEVTLFWTPPFVSSPFYWGLAIDQQGWFYVTDHSNNEQVWRGRDLDGSGFIDPNEHNVYYQTANSTWWDVLVRDDGALLLCEAINPQRLTLLRDLDQNGNALAPGEATQAYDATVAPTLVRPRGAAFLRAPLLDAPAAVPIGQTASLVLRASRPGDLGLLFLSTGLGPALPLPPFGTVEIDPTVAIGFGVGFADSQGYLANLLPIPNSPGLVGTIGLQGLAGDLWRLFLSNGRAMAITP